MKEISVLLRRVAIQAYGRERIAPLNGDAWLAFMDERGNTSQFSQGAAKVFGDGMYQSSVEADIGEILQIAKQWIKGHKK